MTFETGDVLMAAIAFGLGGIAAWLAFARPERSRATAAEGRANAAAETAERERSEREKLLGEKAVAETSLKTERKNHEARVEELKGMAAELERKFALLATEALEKNSRNFLNRVTERFEKHKASSDEDLARRQQAIETLVKPIGESLDKFEKKVGEIEKAREGAYSAVTEQVRTLTEGQLRLNTETNRLVQALRQPQTRGRWGEYQLKNVLEMAGMSEHVDFVTQSTVGEDRRLRPDAIIRLPGGKSIVVDAKTPLEAYLAAVEAGDEEERARHIASHVRHVRDHVRDLASKEYWQALSVTPDFVVMFIPGEPFYSAAVEREPELFEQAVSNRVLIATPMSFIALVKAIAYGWQQHKLAESTQEVFDLARTLFNRIKIFGGHMGDLGKSLRQAVDRYNKSVGSLEVRILPTAREFERLGAVPKGSSVDEIVPIELEARALQAPELIDGQHDGDGSPKNGDDPS